MGSLLIPSYKALEMCPFLERGAMVSQFQTLPATRTWTRGHTGAAFPSVSK
jgi:hypothetical protein